MKGLYCKLSPFTPDSSGAAALFADLPALIIPIDMNGTVSTFRNRVGINQESRVRVCSALGGRELTYVLGDTEGLLDEFVGMAHTYDNEFVVLLHGPVSSLVGVDLRGLALKMEEVLQRPVLPVDCSGNNSYEKGLSAALLEVFERVSSVGVEQCAERDGINVLGVNSVDHNSLQLRELLLDAVGKAAGQRVVSSWGCRDGWDKWRASVNARENIVASVSALKLAQKMEQQWNIPWRCIDELDLGFLAGGAFDGLDLHGARILVISEQFMGNMTRNFLQPTGCDVTVATFHGLNRQRKGDGDVKFASEQDFFDHIGACSYDLVLGDSVLERWVPQNMAFWPLQHAAISAVTPWFDDVPSPFSEAWFGGLAQVLRSL